MRKKILLLLFLVLSFSFLISAQGSWTQKADFPGASRYDAMAFSIGTNGYVIGGFDGGVTRLGDVWEYDAINNIWTQKANFGGTARWMAVSFNIGTKGYIGTGQDNTSYTNDFWEYDPISDSWTQKADLPANGRYGAKGFSIGAKGYIGNGNGATSNGYFDFWEYNSLSNIWIQKANVPGAERGQGVGLSIGPKGYIGTGDSLDGVQYQDFWEYDTLTNLWIQKSNFPGGRRGDIDGAYFTIGSFGYIGLGKQQAIHCNDFWRYDPANDSWSQIPNLPTAGRIGSIGFSINNKGYIGLGTILMANNFSDLWEYSPDDNGVNELANKISLSVYPNPFSTQTTFTFSDYVKDASLKLFSISGKEEKNIFFSGRQLILERDILSSGVYFYQVNSQNKILVTGKIIIQ